MRINKYLAASGICSRREADVLIASGDVTVNGRPAENGMQIDPEQDTVCVQGKPVRKQSEAHRYLLLHKPKGVVTTTKNDPDNVIDYLHLDFRVFPAGRLDRDSEGLLLLTDDGDLAHRLMRGANAHEKEYLVTVHREISDSDLTRLSKGILLKDLGCVTRPCRIKRIDDRRFSMILTQGLNRQIRRMCASLGYRVTRLIRVRIENLLLGDLPAGQYRLLTETELAELRRRLS